VHLATFNFRHIDCANFLLPGTLVK